MSRQHWISSSDGGAGWEKAIAWVTRWRESAVGIILDLIMQLVRWVIIPVDSGEPGESPLLPSSLEMDVEINSQRVGSLLLQQAPIW